MKALTTDAWPPVIVWLEDTLRAIVTLAIDFVALTLVLAIGPTRVFNGQGLGSNSKPRVPPMTFLVIAAALASLGHRAMLEAEWKLAPIVQSGERTYDVLFSPVTLPVVVVAYLLSVLLGRLGSSVPSSKRISDAACYSLGLLLTINATMLCTILTVPRNNPAGYLLAFFIQSVLQVTLPPRALMVALRSHGPITPKWLSSFVPAIVFAGVLVVKGVLDLTWFDWVIGEFNHVWSLY